MYICFNCLHTRCRQRSIAGAKTVLSGTSQPEKQSTPVDAVYEAVDDDTRADISASELPKLSYGQGNVDTPGEHVYQNTPRMTEITQEDTNTYEQPDTDDNEERSPYETIHI